MNQSVVKRAFALDALRGLAIIGMVLSGTIANSLPGWMYHAQVGPRSGFKFDPSFVGITWVDLVFPFFLFAMGAAFPIALNKKLKSGLSVKDLMVPVFKRGLLLVVFAVSIYYCSPYRLTGGMFKYFLAMVAFLSWFLAFLKLPNNDLKLNRMLNYGGYGLLAILVYYNIFSYPEVFKVGFKLSNNDIIILVLANMAVFGAFIWLVTASNVVMRLGLLVLFFAFRLTSGMEGSWNQYLWNFNPITLLPDSFLNLFYNPGAFLYRMDFLKYLNIIIPGTIVGDYLVKWLNAPSDHQQNLNLRTFKMYVLTMLLPLVVITNLSLLYSRDLNLLVVLNTLFMVLGWFLLRNPASDLERFYQSIFNWGLFWLLLGNVLEAYEGGIRKDSATMSYFFMSSGMAIFTLIFFSLFFDYFKRIKVFRYLAECGQNPMVAYVAGTFLVVPILAFSGLMPLLNGIHEHAPWLGIIKGLVVTGLMMVVTILTVRKKLFWKT